METVSKEFGLPERLRLLGSAIREIRRARGISQEALAYQCQLDRSHLGRIERGERNLSFSNILRISDGLECRPSDILLRAGL